MPQIAPGLPNPREYGSIEQMKPGALVDWFVQLHKAKRAGEHQDLRLQLPGTDRLMSWATRKDLPEPGSRIALYQQPLHERAYGSFSGVLSSGYGAGTVESKVRGKALITGVDDDGITFVTAHQRDPERFRLQRTPKGWLLINATRTETRLPYEKVHYQQVDEKDVDKLFTPKNLVTAKIDGSSMMYELLGDKIEALSLRTGKATGRPIVHTERIGNPRLREKLKDTILRGELYATQNGKAIPAAELGGLLNSTVALSLARRKQRDIKLKHAIFDILRYEGQDVRELPYEERLSLLRRVLEKMPEDFHLPEGYTDPAQQRALWERIRTGQDPITREGIVAHPLTAGAVPIKAKTYPENDVIIKAIVPGKGRLKGMASGGFWYALPSDPDKIVGKVGTGLSDEDRWDMWRNPGEWIGRTARIRAQEQFPSGAYRAPGFIARHEDVAQKEAAGELRYKFRRGSVRHTTPTGERVSFPTMQIVAVAEKDGKDQTVGLAEIIKDFHGKPLFRSFQVNPEWRKQGVGREMLGQLLARADQELTAPLYTRAEPSDDKPVSQDKLMSFYGEFGFKPTGKKAKSFPDGGYPIGVGPGAMIRERPAPAEKTASDVGKTLLAQKEASEAESIHMPFPDIAKGNVLDGSKTLTIRTNEELGKYKPGQQVIVGDYAGNSWGVPAVITSVERLQAKNLAGVGVKRKATDPSGWKYDIPPNAVVDVVRFNIQKPLLSEDVAQKEAIVQPRLIVMAALLKQAAEPGKMMAPAAGPDRVSRYMAGFQLGHPPIPGGENIRMDIARSQLRSQSLDRRIQPWLQRQQQLRRLQPRQPTNSGMVDAPTPASPVSPQVPQKVAAYLGGYMDKQAAAIDEAAKDTDTAPTEAQKKSGNYAKGKVSWQGLPLSIENPAGSTRSGTSAAGKKWSTQMRHHYGYILGSKGRDKDHVDVFVKPNTDSGFMVYVVNQVRPATGAFDEHKCMLGFATKAEAEQAYLANYEKGWKGLGSIVPMPLPKFKQWALSDEPAKGELTSAAVVAFNKKTFEESNQGVVPMQEAFVRGYKEALSLDELLNKLKRTDGLTLAAGAGVGGGGLGALAGALLARKGRRLRGVLAGGLLGGAAGAAAGLGARALLKADPGVESQAASVPDTPSPAPSTPPLGKPAADNKAKHPVLGIGAGFLGGGVASAVPATTSMGMIKALPQSLDVPGVKQFVQRAGKQVDVLTQAELLQKGMQAGINPQLLNAWSRQPAAFVVPAYQMPTKRSAIIIPGPTAPGIVAHELGHLPQLAKARTTMALRQLGGLGLGAGSLTAAFSPREDVARHAANVGTLAAVPTIAQELAASLRGMRYLKGKSKLTTLVGLLSYLGMAAGPQGVYYGKKWAGGYRQPNKE